MDIVAALRVKNEARWIREVLESVGWCREIYLFDDHSTDETAEIAADCGAKIIPSPFNGFDEARDKEYLVSHIAGFWPDGTWVLMIDGDEILEHGAEAKIRKEASRGDAHGLRFRIKYLWDSRNQIRVDGVYGDYNRPRIFKLNGHYSFRRSGAPGNLHCFCVPARCARNCRRADISLLHLGYMDRGDRIRKWKWYNSIDPKNRNEGYDPEHPERGSYPWIVQGDIPEVPASAKLLHAGPLRVAPLKI